MLKVQVHGQSHSTRTHHLLFPKPFLHGGEQAFLFITNSRTSSSIKGNKRAQLSSKPSTIKAVASVPKKCIKVKAVVTAKQTIGGMITSLGIERGLDDIKDLLGKTLHLELLSVELDEKTELEKPTVKGYAHRVGKAEGDVKYEAEFEVPTDFGEIGAIFVENEHHKEMFLEDVVLDGFSSGPINISCCSWIHSKYDNKHKRVFFINKYAYLPSQTPEGLTRLREEELVLLRGNGQGERKVGDRIYDYDVYNDIGDPDSSPELSRPVLGGKEHPYPRRCRTGRPRCQTDPLSEKRLRDFYVPRDEAFSEVKQLTFSAKTMYSLFHALIPSLGNVISDAERGFSYFTSIDSLFCEGINMPPLSKQGFWKTMMPRLFKAITDGPDVLRFETPPTMERDKFFWMRDEEFARQTLAGLNPYSIRLVTEWPLTSKLDPAIYDSFSWILYIIYIPFQGMNINFYRMFQAIKRRKLFILDYHDLLLPFVSRVREIKGTTLYGSRTLFFLTPEGTLRPLAIELTRPPMHGKPQWKQVYTPSWNSTGCWLWRLAKAHVLAHDAGYHQLVSHWYAIMVTNTLCHRTFHNRNQEAAQCDASIYRLLHPHFRYTMEINALARESLVNAGGIIESSFTPGKYAMEICSSAYDQLWRFDHQSLPDDLISRGMAIEDLTEPHGIKLTIEDYPFACDGLVLWGIIKQWVTDYVQHYYTDPSLVASDQELQAWWTEIRTVGHSDKKDEPWWPQLKTPRDLIDIITTIVWVASGHHAAVNFGQYSYGGYFPNRPTIARRKMPNEDPTDEEWEIFLQKPESLLLATFPSKLQATKVMAVLNVLSNHSPDEEYIGQDMEPAWAEDPIIKAAFEKFSGRLKELEGIIDERNANKDLKNRCGAGIVPYQFLKPFSNPGVTGQGVPCSISI
ncbi:hypothetical protein K2173_014454 [Erythroxylum novogranatense]|uniref:Lipoxygenase n=1 Tax=Erythroxylum novogranatense TaxID=1862640 RepID=A0AAV8S6M4_9ROSI|nr:hypothetical protein K2173_014454 [Erythroxylum novogranatense]